MGEWRIDSVGDWGTRPEGPGFGVEPMVNTATGGSSPEHSYAMATNGELFLSLRLQLQESGHYEVVELERLTSAEGDVFITGTTLRGIPLGRLADEAAMKLQVYYGENFSSGIKVAVPDVPDDVLSQWPDGDKQLALEWVARIYEAALLLGLPPTKTVGEKFNANRSRAVHMVRRARATGVLNVSSANDPTKRKDRRNGTTTAHDR